MKKNSTDEDPLRMLEDIENIQEILNDTEMRLVNDVFINMNDFYRITENIERALTDNRIDIRDLKVLYYSILKVVSHRKKKRDREEKKKKRNYIRTFFDLPEIINKWLLQNGF
jgi:hypothetical protein